MNPSQSPFVPRLLKSFALRPPPHMPKIYAERAGVPLLGIWIGPGRHSAKHWCQQIVRSTGYYRYTGCNLTSLRRRFLNIRTRKQLNRYIILPPQSMASGRPRLKHPEVNSSIPLNSKTSGFKQIFYTTSVARWGWPPSTYLQKMSP